MLVMVHLVHVAAGRCADFEEALRSPDGSIRREPGFLGFELLRRPAPAETEYLLTTRWESPEAFDAWVCSGRAGDHHIGRVRAIVERVQSSGFLLVGADAKRVG